MKYFLFSSLLFFFVESVYSADVVEKDKIRRLFYYSIQSTDTLVKFEKELKELQRNLDKDFLLAYNGAYLTLVAKHSINPYTKYFRLLEGLELISTAIKNKPSNLEFRFLRLSVLNYVPSFLGFDREFYEDFEKIIILIQMKDFSEVSRSTQKGIVEFLLRSPKLNEVQKNVVRKIYKDFE